MITHSDNDAANAIFVRVGTAGPDAARARRGHDAVRAGLADLGEYADHRTRPDALLPASPPLLPNRHRAYALKLLRTVVPSQRWGIGTTPACGAGACISRAAGDPGTSRIDHQVALLTRNNERLALAVLTAGNGSHAVGKQTLAGVFRRLLSGLE